MVWEAHGEEKLNDLEHVSVLRNTGHLEAR